jgi:biopolymer transport protein ExbD
LNFRSKRRRSRVAATIDITSLVDVVFLLLIFLLITTTFKRDEYAFPLELPTAGTKEFTVRADKTTVFITQDGKLHLLMIPVDQPADEETMRRAKEYTRAELEAELRELQQRRPDAPVAIRAERETRYQRMIDVVALLEQVGFRNIWFPYELEHAPTPTP